MSLLKADTIKPVTSSGDLSLQGDSGGSAVDCLNITSAGDINFTGNTDAKIKLPSAGGIYESDGSTAILTESGGAVTLNNVAIGGSVTGISGTLTGVAYGGSGANTNNVTVADSTTYDLYATSYDSGHTHLGREYWTAVVDGSGSVTLTDLTAFSGNVHVSSPGANLIRMDVVSGGGYSVLLVFLR
jgi:hypothetical protein